MNTHEWGVFGVRTIVALLAVLLLLGGCGVGQPAQSVRLSNTSPNPAVPADSNPETKPLRIAAASIVSPQETIRSYGLFFAYLEQKVGRPIELVQRQTYEETYELLRYGTLDLALVCTYVYVRGHDEIGLDLLGGPEVNGKAQYQSFIIVRSDSDIQSFSDLHGKRFAFTDPLSNSGRLYPLSLLKQAETETGTFFASTTFTYSHDNSIKAVVQGLTDGAAVDSLVYDQWVRKNPDLGVTLRVIGRSDLFPSPPMVASRRLDPAVKEAVRQAILTMHENPEGRAILDQLGIGRFVPQSDADYAPVRALARKVGALP